MQERALKTLLRMLLEQGWRSTVESINLRTPLVNHNMLDETCFN